MRTTNTHIYFYGGPFSNWADIGFDVMGKHFSNSEQYFMYIKAFTFGDFTCAKPDCGGPYS